MRAFLVMCLPVLLLLSLLADKNLVAISGPASVPEEVAGTLYGGSYVCARVTQHAKCDKEVINSKGIEACPGDLNWKMVSGSTGGDTGALWGTDCRTECGQNCGTKLVEWDDCDGVKHDYPPEEGE